MVYRRSKKGARSWNKAIALEQEPLDHVLSANFMTVEASLCMQLYKMYARDIEIFQRSMTRTTEPELKMQPPFSFFNPSQW